MATVEREFRLLAPDEIVAGGVPLATLRLAPTELEHRGGVDWTTGVGALGE